MFSIFCGFPAELLQYPRIKRNPPQPWEARRQAGFLFFCLPREVGGVPGAAGGGGAAHPGELRRTAEANTPDPPREDRFQRSAKRARTRATWRAAFSRSTIRTFSLGLWA